MKKKILCLVMTALMVIGTPLTVNAEDYKGSDGWEVSFDGKDMDSTFGSSDLAADALSILPGDSITLKVKLKEKSGKESDWYMKNDIIQSLEDSTKSAGGGAYSYILKYHDPKGSETLLYSSESVGGESGYGGKKGLHEADAGLDDFFYLDRLSDGQKAYVTLYIKLDGETQGNDYQKTLAKIRMNFAVDTAVAQEIENHILVQRQGMVKTGDNSHMAVFSTLTLVSGLALLALAAVAMKRRHEEKGE
mgnify:CR=1 FL=1